MLEEATPTRLLFIDDHSRICSDRGEKYLRQKFLDYLKRAFGSGKLITF